LQPRAIPPKALSDGLAARRILPNAAGGDGQSGASPVVLAKVNLRRNARSSGRLRPQIAVTIDTFRTTGERWPSLRVVRWLERTCARIERCFPAITLFRHRP
jgi:hypothetical protein